MKYRNLATALLLGTAACTGPGDGPPDASAASAPIGEVAGDPWSAAFDAPWSFDAPRVHLEVLRPEVAELDYEAFMSSREHLQRTLHWGWPTADATLEDNRKDLARHLREHEERVAYAYTVLTPDGSACVGCIYLKPTDGGPRTARLAYWVVEPELATDLDRDLLATVLAWVESDWPLDAVVLRLHADNERGARVAEEAGFELVSTTDEERVLSWRRG